MSRGKRPKGAIRRRATLDAHQHPNTFPKGGRYTSAPLPNGECNCFATFSESRPSVDPSESLRSKSSGVDDFRGVTLGGDYDPPRVVHCSRRLGQKRDKKGIKNPFYAVCMDFLIHAD